MTKNQSEARKRADLVFSKLQAEASTRDRAFDQVDRSRAAGAEKVLRLREARLAKELQAKEAMEASSSSKMSEAP